MPPRLGALVAVVFLGLSFVATKAALRELTPIALIFTRFALGTALLAILLRARGEPLVPPRQTWRGLAVMGFVGVFVHQLLQSFGLSLYLEPLVTLAAAVVLLAEPIRLMTVSGGLMLMAGVLLVQRAAAPTRTAG